VLIKFKTAEATLNKILNVFSFDKKTVMNYYLAILYIQINKRVIFSLSHDLRMCSDP